MGHPHVHTVDDWRPARRVSAVLHLLLLPFAVATALGLFVLWPSTHHLATPLQFTTYGEGKTVYETGSVLATSSKACGGGEPGTATTPAPGVTQVCSNAQIRLSNGPDRGREVSIEVGGSGGLHVSVGDRVRVARGPVIDPTSGQRIYELDDYVRDVPLAVIGGLFALLLTVVARWRGLAALLGVAVAYAVLVEFMLPALVTGHSPVAVALTGAAAILFAVLYLAHGLSSRTTTALLGTLAALGVTALLGAAATSASRLTGRSNEINSDLQAAGLQVSITGLLLCALVVGALGVLNDVTVTQASSVWELAAADRSAGWRALFTSGMRIGRDHIASTVYTLVFAYAGASLPLLLLFSISGRSVHDILTGDEIGGEIVRGAVGGVGLLLAVPLTTLVAAVVAARGEEREAPARPPVSA